MRRSKQSPATFGLTAQRDRGRWNLLGISLLWLVAIAGCVPAILDVFIGLTSQPSDNRNDSTIDMGVTSGDANLAGFRLEPIQIKVSRDGADSDMAIISIATFIKPESAAAKDSTPLDHLTVKIPLNAKAYSGVKPIDPSNTKITSTGKFSLGITSDGEWHPIPPAARSLNVPRVSWNFAASALSKAQTLYSAYIVGFRVPFPTQQTGFASSDFSLYWDPDALGLDHFNKAIGPGIVGLTFCKSCNISALVTSAEVRHEPEGSVLERMYAKAWEVRATITNPTRQAILNVSKWWLLIPATAVAAWILGKLVRKHRGRD